MKHLISIFSLFLMVTSCDSDSGTNKSFDRSVILIQAADSIILPTYEHLVEQIDQLTKATEAFIQVPNATQLANLKTRHFEARMAWKTAEAFNFGPIDDMALASQMDFWPIHVKGVEEDILAYDAEVIGEKILPSNRKGFAVIEYLLFHLSEDEILNQFEQDGRRGMLNYYVNDLLKNAQAMQQEWIEGDYYSTFVTSTGQDVTAGSTLLANELIMLAERTQMIRIGRPLGLTSFTDSDPTLVESFYAQKSLELISANLEIIQLVFNGAEGQGFDYYLDALDLENEIKLSEQINDQIASCISSLKGIQGALQVAILSHPDQVEDLYNELGALIVLLKSDMMSQLGLTVIYGDSDGD